MPSLPRLVRHAHYRCCEKAISPTTPTLLQDLSDMRFQKLGECLPMPPMPGRQSTLEKASLERNNQTLRPAPAQCSLRKVSVRQFYLDRDRIRSRTLRAFKNIFTNLNSRSSVPSSSGVTTPFLGTLPCVIRWVTAVHV